MRTLKVIPWDELRRQYHRRRVLIRVAKEISLAVVLGALIGTALAVGRALWIRWSLRTGWSRECYF